MGFDLVVRGATLVTPGHREAADIGISDGRIAQLGGTMAGTEEFDADGLLAIPGGVDAHTHLVHQGLASRLGFPTWVDDFWSGSRAAIAGGITTIGNMTRPVPDEDGTEETPGAAITREMAGADPEAAVDWFLHPILLHPAALPEGEVAALAEHGHASWPGPEPVTTPAARPAWSQRADAGGSMMSAACRSARAIRSRGLTLCSSSVSSETSSRNGVRSSTPGSPPVVATRLALAAWAVRRAWSARRPATRPLSRVPSDTATSPPVPGLTGVSGAAPGCVSRAASACGPSDTTITSLRDPGRPGLHDGQERCLPGSCLHGNHL